MWGSSDRLEANLLDTILFSGGSITGWFFTGKDGFVMKKSEKHCGTEHIKEVFSAMHESFPKKASDLFCVTYSSEGAPSVRTLPCRGCRYQLESHVPTFARW
jgi:hypothetical protein